MNIILRDNLIPRGMLAKVIDFLDKESIILLKAVHPPTQGFL